MFSLQGGQIARAPQDVELVFVGGVLVAGKGPGEKLPILASRAARAAT